MITVAEALAQIFSLVPQMPVETIPLTHAAGRILAEPAIATRDQPPFPASAMDGYAIHAKDAVEGRQLNVIAEAAAGARFDGTVAPGEAVRIFTGAPLPQGADKILIQEDCMRAGDHITVSKNIDEATYIRPAGADFQKGALFDAPKRLTPADIALLAAMDAPNVTVFTQPDIALIATGDELVAPGGAPGPDQIISSNNYGLAALLVAIGARPRILPIATDQRAALEAVLDLASDADLIVTLGGASVGDHDLMGQLARDGALEAGFYKVAMRPGKPLLAGKYNGTPLIGLPGNPVSAMVCGEVFLRPAVDAMLGLPPMPRARLQVPLAAPLKQNGPREHYMRAKLEDGSVTPHSRQDSALLSVLASSNALLVRAPHAPAAEKGTLVDVITK